MIIINFKTYNQGKNALKLAKKIQKVNKNIIIGVQATDIFNLSKNTKLKIYSQHADCYDVGRNTGFVLPEAVKANGAVGTFLNHSEHKLDFNVLKKTINRCKKVRLKTIVFSSDLKEAKKVEKLKPSLIIIEPPELVASRRSVSQYRPELIKNISNNLNSKFIVGAGIHSKEDVEIAMKLGASGVAVSSAVTKSKNPKKILKELISGLK